MNKILLTFKLEKMKIISKITKLFPVFLLVLGLSGCSNDDDNGTVALENIVDVAISDNDLTSLVAALQRANLVDTVRGLNDITVLAPTNSAFQALLDSNPAWNTLNDVPVDALTNILLNHVISSRIPSVNITNAGNGYTTTNATNADGDNLSLYYEFDSNASPAGVYFNGTSLVTQADIFGTNGVVHKVNQVIGLPTIATFATSNPALDNLVAALQLADTGTPSVPWISTVSDTNPNVPGPLTVFAPTNDAFANLLTELDPTGNTALGDLAPATVNAVLTVHVVNGNNVRSTDLAGLNGVIPTLGGDLSLDVNSLTITDALMREIGIVSTLIDIQATNGVVHVVDRVIRP